MIEYKKYVEGVLSGKIVASKYIKQAAQRIEDFKKRPDMYFDEAEVERCFRFMSYFKEWSGAAAGKSGALLPYQKFVVGSVIGVKWRKDGTRVCRDLFMLIARKNAKTSLIAKLSLYMLLADGEASPFIGCVATSTQQARILFEASQHYLKTIDPDGRAVKQYRNYVKCPSNNGEFHVFSSDSSNMDGYGFNFICEDEIHAYKDNKMDAVLRSSMGARKQPMIARITTAGFLLDGYPCFETYKVAIEILSGVKTDDTFFPFLYVLDPEDIDTWDTNEENWIKCNPGIDVVCSRQYLRDQVQLAHNDSTQVVNVKTKHFNIFCQSASVWLRQEDLAACMKEKFDLEQFRGSTAYIGVDLSATSDTTSLAVMIPQDEKFYFKGWIWLPRATFNKSVNHTLYQEFVNSGDLILTEGNIVDYQQITNKIAELSQIFNIEGIYYDRYNSSQWAIQCTELGYPLKPYSQGLQSFNNPTKEMERLVLSRNAVISKSLMTIWEFNNCHLRVDHAGNIKPEKSGDSKKIDIVIGMLEALGGYLQNPALTDCSIYVL